MLWCVLGGSVLAILVAAINSKNSSLCTGLEVEINGGGKTLFLNSRDVATMLENGGLKEIRTKKMSSVDLQKLEWQLRKNNWIRDVQLYFDNNQVLKVRVQERQPVARIFTVSGNSFLIDSSGIRLDLTERSVFRLPVFTGFPDDHFGLRRDSALCRQIRDLSAFLNSNIFWSNQIQELNISPAKTFHMIPLIGDQVIEFGNGNDYANKFRRLFLFYKEVLTQIGFEKYTSIKLSFEGQVIATRKEGVISRSDSIQARKNVLEMIRKAQKMETDTVKFRDSKPLERNTLTEQNLRSYDLPEEKDIQTETGNNHLKQ